MKKEKDPVEILLAEAFPQTYKVLGPSKLTWYITNKQRIFEFMADQAELVFTGEQQQLNFDPQLLKEVLCREQVKEEEKIPFLATTAVLLTCKFTNPDYGERVAARFIKRLVKAWGPQQLLLVPNYGNAEPKDGYLFWRAIPCIITMRQITFHVLPNELGERLQHGV